MPKPRQVLVIDQDAAHCASVVALIKSMGASTVPFESAAMMFDQYVPGDLGCVIADTQTVGLGGLQFLDALRQKSIDLPAILISGNATVPMAVRAMQAGAVTVLEKPCGGQELWDAVRMALELATELGAQSTRVKKIRHCLTRLTVEEMEVMQLMVDGVPNKGIARRQDVSLRTVEGRRRQVFLKTGADGLADLVRLAIEIGVYADSSQTTPPAPHSSLWMSVRKRTEESSLE